ncbi:MAG: alanine racemase [Sphaerobacteraceae bacterium]|nr:MAG: alanine racemase [Sphaerobacteraceae bacterium]
MAGSFAERLVSAVAGTHAVINLDAYASNVQVMRNRLRKRGDELMMAVVKANAYGHGAVMCARTAIDAGADWLGVARIEEALQLRNHGITAPILVLGPFNPTLIHKAAENDITVTIGAPDALDRILPALEDMPDNSLNVHLKIDTGMRRFGVMPEEAAEVARELSETPAIRYSGIFTHFATADSEDESFLIEQQKRFVETIYELIPEGLAPQLVHFSNSAASLRGTLPDELQHFTVMYRPGLALYGMSPSGDVPIPKEFHRVVTVKTRLGRVFKLQRNEGVSYGLSHVASAPTMCGTLPIGYGDGLNRLLSNRGWMSMQGRRCPIIGRVCMDQTVIDINTISNPQSGDEVIVLGDGRANTMTPEDAAAKIDTINYEVTTAILPRVPRIFMSYEEVVAVEDLDGLVERG